DRQMTVSFLLQADGIQRTSSDVHISPYNRRQGICGDRCSFIFTACIPRASGLFYEINASEHRMLYTVIFIFVFGEHKERWLNRCIAKTY
ncbi:hypothetical protein, partial [Negativicoccus succinicivorans]|uniref:hypothetical protein n=1 Tax=Negativicoccus succinicivorans TaxID=620903 RepID=UPI0029040EEA